MITVLIIIGLFALSAFWFFIGILFAKRNPKYMETIDDAYKKGRTDAEREVKEKLKEAEAYVKSKTGNIPVSPVSAGTLGKYLLRFGVSLLCVFVLVYVLRPEMVATMLYKCCLVLVGYILAEFVWLIGYKRTFEREKKEGRINDASQRSILIFRGMLHASVIISLTLGL